MKQNDMSVLFEGWRRYLVERGPEDRRHSPMQNFLAAAGEEYTPFIKYLKDSIADPRVQAVLSAGLKDRDPTDDVFRFNEGALPVDGLRPTQKEIDLDESLVFPLIKNPSSFVDYATGDGPFTLGAPIITFGSQYIIDGHHRWSQLYACNKNASITTVDIQVQDLEPLDVLKAVQMAIGVELGGIPSQVAKGRNLFEMTSTEIQAWIVENVQKGAQVIELINKNLELRTKLKELAEQTQITEQTDGAQLELEFIRTRGLPAYIWSNINMMQQVSQPVPGAPSRDVMPQTDNVDWQTPLATGKIDIKAPYAVPEPQRAAEE
tara:strand:- start:1296 stop:2255 length:960 start_codon:yes stop_codon:yes gene_type:complete